MLLCIGMKVGLGAIGLALLAFHGQPISTYALRCMTNEASWNPALHVLDWPRVKKGSMLKENPVSFAPGLPPLRACYLRLLVLRDELFTQRDQ